MVKQEPCWVTKDYIAEKHGYSKDHLNFFARKNKEYVKKKNGTTYINYHKLNKIKIQKEEARVIAQRIYYALEEYFGSEEEFIKKLSEISGDEEEHWRKTISEIFSLEPFRLLDFKNKPTRIFHFCVICEKIFYDLKLAKNVYEIEDYIENFEKSYEQ